MKKLLTVAVVCCITTAALADQYIYTPEGIYTVSPGLPVYGNPTVIVTDPHGVQHHGSRFDHTYIWSD